MLPALLAAAQGWRVIYLGADLPADEIVVSVRSTKASVLLLGIVSNLPRVTEELASISRLAPLTTRIWVTGVAVDQYKDLIARANWVLIRNLEELDERLMG
jgi:hypothetical protein